MGLLNLIAAVMILSILLFTLAWLAARRIDNYSIVDALWSLSFGLFALFIILFAPGDPTRKLLFGGMFLIWSLRLGVFLTVRIFSHLENEDSRYKKLREEYAPHVARRFFFFFLYQAVSVVFLLAPLFIVAMNPEHSLSWLELLGAGIWIVGLIGESVADAQMSAFRADPANKGKVCERGLWNYSRHPNYFFECVIWLGYGVFAVASPYGWVGLYATFILWFLILKVTGVPIAEKTSLASRGERFREYQRTTSIFFPLPKRRI